MSCMWLVQSAAEQLTQAREGLDTPLAERLVGVLGMATMIGIFFGRDWTQPPTTNWGRNQPPKRRVGSRPTRALEPPSSRTRTVRTIPGLVRAMASSMNTPLTTPSQ